MVLDLASSDSIASNGPQTASAQEESEAGGEGGQTQEVHRSIMLDVLRTPLLQGAFQLLLPRHASLCVLCTDPLWGQLSCADSKACQ